MFVEVWSCCMTVCIVAESQRYVSTHIHKQHANNTNTKKCPKNHLQVCFSPMLCWNPEKMLPPDLAGMAKMKQHERWAGMLLDKAGVQHHWHSEGLEMWRGSPFFVRGVYLWENSQAAQSEVMSGLFSYSSTKWGCVLFTSFVAPLLGVWEVYSHGFLHSGEIKVERISWDHYLAWLLQQGVSCWR